MNTDIHFYVFLALVTLCVLHLVTCGVQIYGILRDCKTRRKRRERIEEVRRGGYKDSGPIIPS